MCPRDPVLRLDVECRPTTGDQVSQGKNKHTYAEVAGGPLAERSTTDIEFTAKSNSHGGSVSGQQTHRARKQAGSLAGTGASGTPLDTWPTHGLCQRLIETLQSAHLYLHLIQWIISSLSIHKIWHCGWERAALLSFILKKTRAYLSNVLQAWCLYSKYCKQ